MIFTPELIKSLHQRLIEKTGGEFGIKDEKGLESLLGSIYQTFDGKELYPTHIEKASRLCFMLNTSHVFLDGNKRISMHTLAVYLRFHNFSYKPSVDEVIRVGYAIASNQMDYSHVLTWVKETTGSF